MSSTYMCVLDKTDMNKHGQRRRGVDSIKRQSSDGEKQILLQTKPTVLNQTTEEKMNKYPQTNNVKTLNSPTVCAPTT